ncbi:Rgp1-domain-containing protein [Calycina marina]|uniref:Rgp1-domain-containing protein n=1 Tax=Calycina marina TaxID=1763456 RepID=A0A9P8CDK9_9HELO|nr:Rgp1-domain-containing protein [Calycina marina]
MIEMSTNMRVFVKWTEQIVFAGEEIECEITLKNTALSPHPSSTSLHPQSANGLAQRVDRQSKGPTAQLLKGSHGNSSRPPPVANRGHRTAVSLSSPIGLGITRAQPGSGSWNGPPSTTKEGGSHKRSVSIVSMGRGSESTAGTTSKNGSFSDSQRPSRGHGRSASLHIIPRRNGGAGGGPLTAPLGMRSSTQPSPRFPSPLHASHDMTLPERPGIRQFSTTLNTPQLGANHAARRRSPGIQTPAFSFPASPTEENGSVCRLSADERNDREHPELRSPRSKDPIPTISEQAVPTTRIISPSSIVGTPRSSGDFYSLSNNSTETLSSEYHPQHSARLPSHTAHVRRPSNLSPTNHHRPPETLMMGYAQINGSFTVDGSLISQNSFEEVKRKGAVGGQGGGVIGVESKRDSGMLKSFGWGSIGDSIGNMLGGGELSSIKEMRSAASSRSIPLLSTPQSILFVDLRLAPGESKTFKYSFKLPRGLPPSHRGKAIKITYKLVIGTQRPGGAKEQQVKSVEFPFRILGSVNDHGELLGHDLMFPYIILRDQAKVTVIENNPDQLVDPFKKLKIMTGAKPQNLGVNDFLAYVDELINRKSNMGLLSPTEASSSRRPSSTADPASVKEAIDMAILRSNTATEYQQSANRFEIARSGQRVAVVMLARPAYRLGETVTVAIDFTDAEIPCYAIHASLESSEKVENSIALRSEASILRVTRKVYASHSESTLFARRIVISPTIPVSATPDFITSGVSLEWHVRIEFVTPRLTPADDHSELFTDLLEEVSRDDRSVILGSAEALDCESFEIAVPLRVYGAIAGNMGRDDSPSEGLVV